MEMTRPMNSCAAGCGRTVLSQLYASYMAQVWTSRDVCALATRGDGVNKKQVLVDSEIDPRTLKLV